MPDTPMPSDDIWRGLVPMVQSTDFGYRDYTSLVAALDRPRLQSVFVDRQMGAGLMIMSDEQPEPAAQVPLTEHDHMAIVILNPSTFASLDA